MNVGEDNWVGVRAGLVVSVGSGTGEGDCCIGLHAETRIISSMDRPSPNFTLHIENFSGLQIVPIFIYDSALRS